MVFETVFKKQLQVHATSILEASIENPEAYDYELDLSTLIASYTLHSEEEKADQEAINLVQKILFAGTIHHTANALETLEYLTIEDAQLQSDFTYHRVNNTKVKAFKVPQFNKSALLCPTLGPLSQFGEHPMERYCAYTCIRYLLYQTTASKFAATTTKVGKNTYFAPSEVTLDRLPAWMSKDTVLETPGAEAIIDLMHQYKPAPNQISLRLVREDVTDDDDKLTDHINTFLRRCKIHLQKEDTTYQHDTSEFNVGPQWRDHLRHVLLLPRLWCDFSTLTLFSLNEAIAIEPGPVHVPKECPWTIYNNDNPEQVIPWTDVQEILQAGAKFQIQYALKVIDTNEDGPYPFEFNGGPIQVRSNIAIATTVSTAIRDTIMADEPDNTRPQPMESLALDDKPQCDDKGKGPKTTEAATTTPSYLEGSCLGQTHTAFEGL
ncbi:hypothetical protein VC83_04187 [Pseudogymnoascus destructans]|uniref:Uncharacterized protein n=1 Tax=Pseudogymnoascus destructans TaxID=655981 RepID=A0A177AAR5_9PEZI|nr:uncharacterized protein VC83_04187 [Pseudogymnoascus destructans]OAF59236.1 hypothetical protein VC83_04187 [Pseudogymnoascus destructans]